MQIKKEEERSGGQARPFYEVNSIYRIYKQN